MTADDRRPNPEAMLLKAKREEREQSSRGRLRIYLGAFPGVGKTYAMLSEGQRRKSYGEDIVVGFVETHGRKATAAMLEGLEVLPRRKVEYRGVIVEELDVEAVFERRPAVCLIDELAHTNTPGSEREKRYEDVQLIIQEGINVVTTLNIQHLESLNDTIASLTGVKVRETIPDQVVDDADELILIDLPPEAARARMQHGHIYPPAQAAAALENFFKPANLAALRELALRRTAEEVDEQLQAWMRETGREQESLEDHVLVYIDSSPFARTLVRRAWRLAQALKGDLLVAYVKRDLSDEQETELARTIELAEDLNARVTALGGQDDAKALAALIGAEGVQHIVLPQEHRSSMGRLKASLVDRLIAVEPNIEVHLVPGSKG
jgi:two-component system sensor histidine kinase KdpD